METLSIESIGWLFIQKYYSTYATETPKLYAFYDQQAAVLHDAFPEDLDEKLIKNVHLATGHDAIKKLFGQTPEEKNKIVVDRADFQDSVDGSILIVVCGLWKRGTSPVFLFVQTFVLKAKEKTVYDIANDVLRFLDLTEEYRPVDVNIVETKVEKEEKEENEVKEKEEVEEKEEKEKTEDAEEQEEKEKTEDAEEKKEAGPAVEPAVESNAESTTDLAPEPEAEAAEAKDEKPVKQTWANLAAIEPKGTTNKNVVAKQVNAAPKKSSPPAANGRYKRDEWFPIYIRNVDVEEEELKAALVKLFGEVKFFKKNGRSALCDFRVREDQRKALEAKELVVRGVKVLLEPRVHKTPKPDARYKDKKVKKVVKK